MLITTIYHMLVFTNSQMVLNFSKFTQNKFSTQFGIKFLRPHMQGFYKETSWISTPYTIIAHENLTFTYTYAMRKFYQYL